MNLIMKSGIYILINEETHKAYIGQSVRMQTRFATHRLELSKNRHYNKYLQHAYNALKDKANLKYEILEFIPNDKTLLNAAEEFWISYFISWGFSIAGTLYNMRDGGNSWSQTKERKEHMSKIMIGVNSGSKHGRAMLKEEDINLVRYCIKCGVEYGDIARYFGISESLPPAIANGKAWTHIPYVETQECYDLERYLYYEKKKEHIERYRKVYEKQMLSTIKFKESIRNNAHRPLVANIKKYAKEFEEYFNEILEMRNKRFRVLDYAEYHYRLLTIADVQTLVDIRPSEFYQSNKDCYFALTEASKVYSKKQDINQAKAAAVLLNKIKKKEIQYVQVGKRYFILKELIA
jgi:hypothetical protein